MLRRLGRWTGLAGLGLISACDLVARCTTAENLDAGARAALHATALPAPGEGLQVYHLGHSLVGHDMPAMVAQLAEAAGFTDHGYNSQLGWGTSLRAHWGDGEAIAGFKDINHAPAFRSAREALQSGDYDALVMTEMVELRDAVRWHASGDYLGRWAALGRSARPDLRVYLYESWHALDTPDGWLTRLDQDPDELWEGTLLAQAMAQAGAIHIIPAGRVMAQFVRRLEDQGGLPGLEGREGLFARAADGSLDMIHPGDLGTYLVALVHVATLYHLDPRSLPHALTRADGSPAEAPSPEVAALMQQVVWDIVHSLPQTGLQQRN